MFSLPCNISHMLMHSVIFTVNLVVHYLLWFVSESWWLMDGASTIYLPLGLRLGFLLLLPWRFWPTMLISDIATYMALGTTGAFNLDISVWLFAWLLFQSYGFEYYLPLGICKFFVKRFIGDSWLNTVPAVLAFLACAVVIQLGNAHDTMGWSYSEHIHIQTELTMSHFVGGLVAILYVTPLMLTVHYLYQFKPRLNPKVLAESSVIAILVVVLSVVSYEVSPQSLYLLRILAFIPLVIFCYRYGWLGGTALMLVMNSLLLINTAGSRGSAELHDSLFYMFAFSIVSLIMGAAMSEQKTLNNELTIKNGELEKANQKNIQLARKVIDIQESERKKLSQELHDEVGQNIVVLQAELEVLQNRHAELRQSDTLSLIKISSKQIYDSIYQLLLWLRPRVLDEFGLYKTLKGKYFLTRLASAKINYVTIVQPELDSLNHEISIAIFRLVQEAVTNAIKHSNASELSVSTTLSSNKVELVIKDDGQGFPMNIEKLTSQTNKGFGLTGMVDRVSSLQGSIQFINNHGAEIRACIPHQMLSTSKHLD